MTWMTDRDHRDDRGTDATCTDCGRDFVNGPDVRGALCDECCDERDAHSSVLEIRMAKASLKETPESLKETPVVVEAALVRVDPAQAGPVVEMQLVPVPPGYLDWLDALRANARYGPDALAHAWYIAPVIYTEHLLTVAPDLWLTLKAIARRVA